MVYKQFSVQVIVRVFVLLVTLVCLAYIFARTDLFFTQLILFLILTFQIYDLVRLVTQTNRNLAEFLLAIKNSDYSVNFLQQNNKGQGFQQLHASFQEIIHSYKAVERQKESQLRYFKLMIQQVDVGIISLSEKNEIVLSNKAAEHLLKIPYLQSWTQLQAKNAAFAQTITKLKEGGRQLIEVVTEEEVKQLSVQVSPVLLMGEPYLMITFQDIKREIEQKEIEAWHKLIHILTHEIMNSVTPVVSLTETMLMILEEQDGSQKKLADITEENIEDIRFSLKTIQRRSGSMLHFVNDYRKLTRLPTPQPEKVRVVDLFDAVSGLMQGEMSKHEIKLSVCIPDTTLTIEADVKLIEQVLINLLTNSIQALEGIASPVIELSSYTAGKHIIIEVSDNGKGIEQDKLDKIFIPFYSTKEKGTGIGLSLSRQIMNLHNATISVSSQKGIKTSFKLQFPSR